MHASMPRELIECQEVSMFGQRQEKPLIMGWEREKRESQLVELIGQSYSG